MQTDNMVFVFGSNEAGIHGGGAAKFARDKRGAIMGQGVGYSGQSYGIPTCSRPTGEPNHEIPIEKIEKYIEDFVDFAYEHPELTFQVTQVGCGLAGWKAEQIAPLFVESPDNCYFDTAWKEFLPDETKFWGTL